MSSLQLPRPRRTHPRNTCTSAPQLRCKQRIHSFIRLNAVIISIIDALIVVCVCNKKLSKNKRHLVKKWNTDTENVNRTGFGGWINIMVFVYQELRLSYTVIHINANLRIIDLFHNLLSLEVSQFT